MPEPTSALTDVVANYHAHLASPASPPMPIAAIHALCDLVTASPSTSTTSELLHLVQDASRKLRSSLPNPVPASAGLDLFARLVVTRPWDATADFDEQKHALVDLARHYADNTVPNCRQRIAEHALSFIKRDAIILTHSYSRVVMQILLAAHAAGRRIGVYVTESRPGGLGLRTHAELLKHGVPCTVVCDTSIGYLASKLDLCLVGAEGVCESGGLLNAVGTVQMAMIMASVGKPVYAAAESFKFLRLFPLSQFDVPQRDGRPILPLPILDRDEADREHGSPSFKGLAESAGSSVAAAAEAPTKKTTTTEKAAAPTAGGNSTRVPSTAAPPYRMTEKQENLNPLVDYTPPELVTLLFSDVGVLAPTGVADALLAVYGAGTPAGSAAGHGAGGRGGGGH